MQAILIWDNIPEDRDTYLLPSEVHETYKAALEAAHNKHVNADPHTDELDLIMDATMSDKYADSRTHKVSFQAYRVSPEKPLVIEGPVTVYHSGMYM